VAPPRPPLAQKPGINASGSLLSATVFLTAAITKFTDGAWVALLAIGLGILVTTRIRHHYDVVGKAIALRPYPVEVPTREFPGTTHQRPARATAAADGHTTHRTQTEYETDTRPSTRQTPRPAPKSRKLPSRSTT